jgi:hypothetical protein
VGNGSLDPADIGTIHPGIVSQGASLVTDAAQVDRESMAEVHASNQSLCGLLTHGFKAAKNH